LVKNPNTAKYWHPQTLASWGFGYEIMLSPLQLLMVYNAVANNGKMMKPYLLNEVRSYGTVVQKNEPTVLNEQIGSASTIRQLQECLKEVCISGTGKLIFANSPYKVAGKTGTAKVNDGKFKYGDGVYQSAFAGYFPADHPKYSIIVVVKNKPHAANYYGGSVAAPVFREIADHLYKYSLEQQPFQIAVQDSMLYTFGGMKKEIQSISNAFQFGYNDAFTGNWRTVALKNKTVQSQVYNTSSSVIPDLRGMGLKDALYVLENNGLSVQINGKGKVVGQSITAGSPVNKGQSIILYLN
jgi:cell division protein FtsI (penicillin-binding protein 3)